MYAIRSYYVITSLLIKTFGYKWIDVVFPTAAMGAIVAIIGLELAPVAANMAGLTAETLDPKTVAVAMITFATVVFGSVLFRGFLAVIPILIAILVGYGAAWALGMVDFAAIAAAPAVKMPSYNFV